MNTHYDEDPKTMKEAVRGLIEEPLLADEKINQLLALQRGAGEKPASSLPSQRALFAWQLTPKARLASFAVLCLLAVLFSVQFGKTEDHSRQIAQEVVKNHIKLKPLEVHANSIVDVRPYFKQLDFVPVQSAIFGRDTGKQGNGLIGGRYCSIMGVTAAQLRYEQSRLPSAGDDIATLYQVAYEPELHGKIPHLEDDDPPKVLSYNGLEVQLWVEEGLLMVSVGHGED